MGNSHQKQTWIKDTVRKEGNIVFNLTMGLGNEAKAIVCVLSKMYLH